MLAFTDQSGTIHKNAPEARPVLLTLCMMESDVGDLTRRIHNIKERIMGLEDENNPMELHATNFINPKCLAKKTKNKELVDQVFDLMLGYNVAVFAAVMYRPETVLPDENADVLPNRYRFLLERVSYFAEEKKSLALLVYDEESTEKIRWRAINNFLYKHNLGKQLYILEMPLFVKSLITPGIQVADLMASVVRHYYEKNLDEKPPENPFESWICELFSIIRRLTYNFTQRGRKNYGIFLI